MDFIKKLTTQGVMHSSRIIEAFKRVPREDFVPELIRDSAQQDEALPTFAGQTISQPYTVAFMLELLKPQAGQTILDVGSGSGWVAAILAQVVGKTGKVYGVERIKELVQFSRDNLKKYGFNNLEIQLGDGSLGLPKAAPFDRIHVAAAASVVPMALKNQLAVGGRIVIPTRHNDIRLIERMSEKKFKETVYPGFVFVPLIESQKD